MAWTTPITWADSTVYDDADFDAQIKNNLGFLYSPPSCLTVSANSQNISNNTNTDANMATELWDTDTMHGATLSRHDINTAGTYLMFGTLIFPYNGTGGRQAGIRLDDGTVIRMYIPAVPSVTNTGLQVAHTGLMGTTDYHDLYAWQNSGTTLALAAGASWMLSHWRGNP